MLAQLAAEFPDFWPEWNMPYWVTSLLRVVGGLVAVLLPAGGIVYLFLFKMMSFMQSRLGPMEAGPYGSMQLLAATAGRVAEIVWTDGRTNVAVCRSGRAIIVHGRAGDRVSIIPGMVKATGVSTAGLRWTLENESLSAGSSRGISNIMIGERAVITVDSGIVLAIHERTDQ